MRGVGEMAVLLLALAAHAAVPPAPAPPVASCELLELAHSFAGLLLASDFHRGRGAMAAVGDALELGAQAAAARCTRGWTSAQAAGKIEHFHGATNRPVHLDVSDHATGHGT